MGDRYDPFLFINTDINQPKEKKDEYFDLTHYTNNLKNNVPRTLAAVCCTFIYSLSLCPSSLSARNEIILVVSAENNQTHVCIHFSKRVWALHVS